MRVDSECGWKDVATPLAERPRYLLHLGEVIGHCDQDRISRDSSVGNDRVTQVTGCAAAHMQIASR